MHRLSVSRLCLVIIKEGVRPLLNAIAMVGPNVCKDRALTILPGRAKVESHTSICVNTTRMNASNARRLFSTLARRIAPS